eukprot:SAG11_NODE_181_length_13239_cov_10.587139_10_plen_58_part_00
MRIEPRHRNDSSNAIESQYQNPKRDNTTRRHNPSHGMVNPTLRATERSEMAKVGLGD